MNIHEQKFNMYEVSGIRATDVILSVGDNYKVAGCKLFIKNKLFLLGVVLRLITIWNCASVAPTSAVNIPVDSHKSRP